MLTDFQIAVLPTYILQYKCATQQKYMHMYYSRVHTIVSAK